MDGPSEEWCKSLENVREAQWESNCEEIMCLKKLGFYRSKIYSTSGEAAIAFLIHETR